MGCVFEFLGESAGNYAPKVSAITGAQTFGERCASCFDGGGEICYHVGIFRRLDVEWSVIRRGQHEFILHYLGYLLLVLLCLSVSSNPFRKL